MQDVSITIDNFTVSPQTGNPNCNVNDDLTVDMADISITVEAFLSYPEHPRWNPDADINNDGSIDMVDISTAIDHFMQS
jgi:hypothetical protein